MLKTIKKKRPKNKVKNLKNFKRNELNKKDREREISNYYKGNY